jgi:hypothetical protein
MSSPLILNPQSGNGGDNITCDGITISNSYTTYTGAHDAVSAYYVNTTVHNGEMAAINATDLDHQFRISRGFFSFDLGELLESYNITSGVLSLYGTYKLYEESGNLSSINIYTSTQNNANTLDLSDYSQVDDVELSTAISYIDWNEAGYNNFVLNTSGLATLIPGGVVKFCTRVLDDVNNIPITTHNDDGGYQAYYYGYFADNAENMPKLSIYYGGGEVTAAYLYFGRTTKFTGSHAEYANGSLTDITLWNRAISPYEQNKLYNNSNCLLLPKPRHVGRTQVLMPYYTGTGSTYPEYNSCYNYSGVVAGLDNVPANYTFENNKFAIVPGDTGSGYKWKVIPKDGVSYTYYRLENSDSMSLDTPTGMYCTVPGYTG